MAFVPPSWLRRTLGLAFGKDQPLEQSQSDVLLRSLSFKSLDEDLGSKSVRSAKATRNNPQPGQSKFGPRTLDPRFLSPEFWEPPANDSFWEPVRPDRPPNLASSSEPRVREFSHRQHFFCPLRSSNFIHFRRSIRLGRSPRGPQEPRIQSQPTTPRCPYPRQSPVPEPLQPHPPSSVADLIVPRTYRGASGAFNVGIP
jgi:hypothetical protein